VAAAAFLALRAAAARGGAWPAPATWHRLVMAGGVVFVAGWLIFLATLNASITATGMSNRVALAAACGIALALVGAAGLVAGRARSHALRARLFAGVMAAWCGACALAVVALGRDWTAAWTAQQSLLAQLHADVPAPAAGTVLVLDGACPYVGPAPVFEGGWDATGAVRLLYGEPRLAADVVSPRLVAGEAGISTTLWQDRFGPYRYGDVLLYDARSRRVVRPADATSARAWLDATPPADCPPSRPGVGAPAFR